MNVESTNQVVNGMEGDEIVDGVRLDDELERGAQQHGGAEIGEREGDGATEIAIAGVPQQTHSGVSPVLDRHLLFVGGHVHVHVPVHLLLLIIQVRKYKSKRWK